MAKPIFSRVLDDEGYVHVKGCGQAVNIALCGWNGDVVEDDYDGEVNCLPCRETLRHVYRHQREDI